MVDRANLQLQVDGQPVSYQHALMLSMTAGVSLEAYLVYAHLKRLGFVVKRAGVGWHELPATVAQPPFPSSAETLEADSSNIVSGRASDSMGADCASIWPWRTHPCGPGVCPSLNLGRAGGVRHDGPRGGRHRGGRARARTRTGTAAVLRPGCRAPPRNRPRCLRDWRSRPVVAASPAVDAGSQAGPGPAVLRAGRPERGRHRHRHRRRKPGLARFQGGRRAPAPRQPGRRCPVPADPGPADHGWVRARALTTLSEAEAHGNVGRGLRVPRTPVGASLHSRPVRAPLHHQGRAPDGRRTAPGPGQDHV